MFAGNHDTAVELAQIIVVRRPALVGPGALAAQRLGLASSRHRLSVLEFGFVLRMNLGALLDRSPANLSGGERQRVALGRALLSQPKLLLMDEPLSSLDAGAKAEILPYLERLHRSLAIPALYVSHAALEIARLADRVIYMAGGQIVPREAADEPTLDGLGAATRDGLARAALRAGLQPLP